MPPDSTTAASHGRSRVRSGASGAGIPRAARPKPPVRSRPRDRATRREIVAQPRRAAASQTAPTPEQCGGER
jgi:hypothetical protein